MPLYRLVNDDGSIACDGDARDDEHALAVLGAKLGKTLAFDGTGQSFMMQRVEANQVQWDKRDGFAVYVVDPPT